MLKRALIYAAADLWAGCTPNDVDANPEYLRGQVELICLALGLDSSDYRDEIRREIIAAAQI